MLRELSLIKFFGPVIAALAINAILIFFIDNDSAYHTPLEFLLAFTSLLAIGGWLYLRNYGVLQATLNDRELRLTTVVSTSPVGIFETDAKGNCTFVNTKWCELAGLNATQALGDGWAHAMHPDDRAKVFLAWQEFVDGDKDFHLEYRFKKPDGAIVWVYGLCLPIRNKNNEIIGYTGSVTDITPAKTHERHRLILENAINSSINAIVLADTEGKIYYANQSFIKLWRYNNLDQVTGLNICNLCQDTDQSKTIMRQLTTSGAWDGEIEGKTFDGEPLIVRVAAQRVLDANNQLTAFMASIIDLSQLKANEHIAHIAYTRLNEAQRLAKIGSWELDLVSGVLVWSDEIFHIFEIDQKIFGASYDAFLNAIHPDDREAVNKAYTNSVVTKKPYEITHRLKMESGQIKWVSESCETFYAANGKPLRSVGTVQDITDRIETLEELRKSKEQLASLNASLESRVEARTAELGEALKRAEEASNAKSEFLGRMSHELRTPMNAILGFAQVIETEDPTPTQLEYAHEIIRAGDHLLELINELLDLSRIEAGKLAIVVVPVDPALIVEQVAQIMAPLMREQHIKFTNVCQTGQYVLADHTRLRQILVNLLANATKYNKVNGEIEVRCNVNNGYMRISVKDNGIGIPKDKFKHLFTPFERLGAENTVIDGTGIGLALTKQLTELMAGKIGAESEQGVGSTFWIELPIALSPTLSLQEDLMDTLPQQKSPQRRVLYVEDNPANMRVIEAVFRSRPQLQLLSAVHGEQGLEMAITQKPDVILLDIHLPGMDGFAVLNALKNNPITANIPVIALSADAMPADIEKGLKAGFKHYITKPVKINELLAALDLLCPHISAA
ncbi:MAG: PAS domain S-box protein [Gammaproteobacteria bacterium]|nr:PAS domain S-box protein [Gammaproteobacteria bacterium]